MTLKSLPFEGEALQSKIVAKPFDRKNILAEIKKRLTLKEISHDEKIVDKACYKMIRYVQNGKHFSLDELKDLLASLERSVMTIQKRKKQIVEKKNKRYK